MLERKIIKFIFIFSAIFGFFLELHILPQFVFFITDILILGLLISLCNKTNLLNHRIKILGLLPIYKIVFIILIIGLISSLLNFVRIDLIIWELRTYFRGIIFFTACIYFLKRKDIHFILNAFQKLLYVNVLLCIFEYYVLGIIGDATGGTFNGNGGLVLFCLILIPYIIFRYFRYEISLQRFILDFLSIFIIATLAELKIVYYIIILTSIFAIFFTQKNKRITQYLCILPILLVVGSFIIINFFGIEYFNNLYNEEQLNTYVNQEGAYGFIEGSFNRGTAIKQTTKIFFENKPFYHTLIGYGFGSGSTSDLFKGQIATEFTWTNYFYFATSYILIEQGWIGFILFLLMWTILAWIYFKLSKKIDNSLILSCFFISLLMIINIWYNATIKGDVVYIIYIFLSLPFIMLKSSSNNKYKL